jgi:hypothetical protein
LLWKIHFLHHWRFWSHKHLCFFWYLYHFLAFF